MPTTQANSAAKKRRAPARRSTRKSAAPAKKDAIALLRADHKKVDDLFKQYDKARSDSRKQALAQQICQELIVHTTVEEEIFYPAVRGAIKDADLMDEADIEHASAKELIAQLQAGKPGDDHYDAKVTVLGEYIRHHVKEEQNEMFPKAKKTKLDMLALGEQIAERKAQLLANNGNGDGSTKSRSLLSMLSLN